MFMSDTLQLGKPRRTSEGYLAVRAKAARSGIQDYMGYEVDPEGKHFAADEVVPVYRPAEEVFDTKAVHSFLMKPITNDHPREPVTKDNWSKLAKGVVAKAMRDGEDLAFDLVLMDGPTIDAVESGKRELSGGYAVDLAIESGVTFDGKPYKAVQRNPRGNHIAIVAKGRAGPEYRINDSVAQCDANPEAIARLTTPEKPTMKITIGDAKDVDLSDGAAVALAVGALNTSLADAQTKVGALTADLATANTALQTKDGEIAALTAQLADATITPEKLQALADARADVIAKAKTLAPALATDGKPDAEIRKAAVTAKLGDAAKDMSDAAIEGAFVALTKDAKPAAPKADPIGTVVIANDHQATFDAARSARLARYATAYKNAPAVAS